MAMMGAKGHGKCAMTHCDAAAWANTENIDMELPSGVDFSALASTMVYRYGQHQKLTHWPRKQGGRMVSG